MDLYERLRARKADSSRPDRETDHDRPQPDKSRKRTPASSSDDARARGLLAGGWHPVGEFAWARAREFAVDEIPAAETSLLMSCPPSQLIYFDTETTGLSGGSGTMVFLVGLGRILGDVLSVEQVFLADYPGEPAFLEYLAGRMPEDATYVSYNGKAFDTHLLAMRHLMNGREFATPRHIDLLYPARRLWKTMLDSCSLGDIEAHVLGVDRAIDIPGFLIPDTYFAYLRSGDSDQLEAVFEHHSEDIVSLHRLLVHIERLAADPLRYPADRLQLGRLLLDRDAPRGEDLLRRLAGDDPSAALELGRYLKRERRADEAFEVYHALFERNGSPTAGVELAKHLEHRGKRYGEAYEIVADLVMRPDCAHLRESLRYRLKRLERKLGGP